MKFAFDNKDLDFVVADVPDSQVTLEVRKIDKIHYSIFYSCNDSVCECGTFNGKELKMLWKMLTGK